MGKTFRQDSYLHSPSKMAAGLGLEPRLPDPESGVLPLDDPAISSFLACLLYTRYLLYTEIKR